MPKTHFLCRFRLHAAVCASAAYNQSLLLARAAAQELHIPCLDLLCKTRENETQHELGRAAREQNVRNVYAVKPGIRPPGRAIVVDDIVTTGHTLAACVAALRKAGIEVCCCARRGGKFPFKRGVAR